MSGNNVDGKAETVFTEGMTKSRRTITTVQEAVDTELVRPLDVPRPLRDNPDVYVVIDDGEVIAWTPDSKDLQSWLR